MRFYTRILGFVRKSDFPVGRFKRLTVVSPEEPDGAQLLLEPNDNPAAKTSKRRSMSRIPATSFSADDIQKECLRMRKMGVVFRTEPTETGGATVDVFEDTCGNLIQIAQV